MIVYHMLQYVWQAEVADGRHVKLGAESQLSLASISAEETPFTDAICSPRATLETQQH